jgi:hypothetical protein
MSRSSAQQRFSRLTEKKHAQQFSLKNGENSVESGRPNAVSKPFAPQKPENGLAKARLLCLTANINHDVLRSVFLHDLGSLRAGLDLKLGESLGAATDRLPENLWLSQQLASLVDSGKCLVGSVIATIDAASGHTRFSARDMFQDVLDEVLRDPRVDSRRFARCKECNRFFYRPRESSRTCSRKCENRLVARERYAREKQNRVRALELQSQGKTPFEIRHELGLQLAKVRNYLRVTTKPESARVSRRNALKR